VWRRWRGALWKRSEMMGSKGPYRQKLSKGEKLHFHAKQQSLRDLQGVFGIADTSRNVKSAGDFIGSIIKEVGAREGVEHQKLLDSWQKIAGDFVAKNTEPVSLNHGVLMLKVVQPSMRFHLEQLKMKLLKNLQQDLGKSLIKQVKFVLG